MSSTNLTGKLSEITGFIGGLVKNGGVADKLLRLAFSGLKLSSSPLFAAVTGGKIMLKSTLGRVAIVLVLLLATFGYLKHHFTAIESAKWALERDLKQTDIIKRADYVNAQTAQAQKVAAAQAGLIDRILAVVVDGIWKVQPPVPIEAETIDLINQTRGDAGKVGRR